MNRIWKASMTTERAQDWLSHSQSPKILNVFNQSCNLINEQSRVLSLVTPEIGPGPFTIVIDRSDDQGQRRDFSTWVRRESLVQIGRESISLGKLEIDVALAQCWYPKPDWDKFYQQRRFIFQAFSKLIPFLVRIAPSESLMQLFGSFSSDEHRPRQVSNSTLGISDRLKLNCYWPIQLLRKGITEGQMSICDQAIQALAGLGGGLTPAGDDFIIGVTYALRVIFPRIEADRLAQRICDLASAQTHPLSAAYLQAAARGEATYLWHSLLNSSLLPEAAPVREIVLRFLDVGHTSGFDAMAGFASILPTSVECTWD